MLAVRETIAREVKELSGLWDFKVDFDSVGTDEKWYRNLETTKQMAVPSSYNDISTDKHVRDHVGDVWYQKNVVIPKTWKDKRIVLRVGSASHNATVWINGEKVYNNVGGFLPFEVEISKFLNLGEENSIVIKVNNELTWQTLPPGEVITYEGHSGKILKKQKQQHDFFNYSGIHRPVYLYTTEETYVEDITVNTTFEGNIGKVAYNVVVSNYKSNYKIKVSIYDKGCLVGEYLGIDGEIKISDVKLWQPKKAYLYKMVVEVLDEESVIDAYNLEIGVRTVELRDGQLHINGKPFYFNGFGKHEDSDIRGKGLDHALNLRDFELIEWIDANSFRTSHYPYAEEIIEMADRNGILIIDEAPAVGMLGQSVPAVGELGGVFREDKINSETLKNHIKIMKDLIRRDKNHPSVVIWCVANEASTMEKKAGEYFKTLIEEIRKEDSRPIMNVNLMLIEPGKCEVSKYVDIIGLNLYFGWYSEPGNIQEGKARLKKWLEDWYKFEGKPIFLTEYGVDTLSGLHKLPSIMFSEEYQREFLEAYHEVFDELPFVIGEHIWNFADFMTHDGIVRVDGNKKGVFMRQRQPKSVAFDLKRRWKNHVKRI